MDDRQKLIFRRMSIESNVELAKKSEAYAKHMRERMENELTQLQRECPHEKVVVNGTWQGGGLYYDKAHCQDCNKKGDRYNRKATMEENRSWYKEQFDEEKHAPRYSGFMGDKGEKDW